MVYSAGYIVVCNDAKSLERLFSTILSKTHVFVSRADVYMVGFTRYLQREHNVSLALLIKPSYYNLFII